MKPPPRTDYKEGVGRRRVGGWVGRVEVKTSQTYASSIRWKEGTGTTGVPETTPRPVVSVVPSSGSQWDRR